MTITASIVSSSCFSLVQCLPRLQDLELTVGGGALGLTGAALRTMGEHCRHVETLDCCGVWDLSCWRDTRAMPLFPELSFFRLDEAIMKPAGAAYDK